MRTWKRKELRKDAAVFKAGGRIEEAEKLPPKTEEERSHERTGCRAKVAQGSTVNGRGTGRGASSAWLLILAKSLNPLCDLWQVRECRYRKVLLVHVIQFSTIQEIVFCNLYSLVFHGMELLTCYLWHNVPPVVHYCCFYCLVFSQPGKSLVMLL